MSYDSSKTFYQNISSTVDKGATAGGVIGVAGGALYGAATFTGTLVQTDFLSCMFTASECGVDLFEHVDSVYQGLRYTVALAMLPPIYAATGFITGITTGALAGAGIGVTKVGLSQLEKKLD